MYIPFDQASLLAEVDPHSTDAYLLSIDKGANKANLEPSISSHIVSNLPCTFSDPVIFSVNCTLHRYCSVLTKDDSLDTWGQMKTQPWGNTLEIEPFVYIYLRQHHITFVIL